MSKVTDELTFWKRGGLSGLCLRRRVRDWMLVGPPPRKSTRRKGRTDQAQKTLKNGSKQKRRLWPAVSGITITCCPWQAGPLWLVSPAGSVRLSQGTHRRIALIQTRLIYLQRLNWWYRIITNHQSTIGRGNSAPFSSYFLTSQWPNSTDRHHHHLLHRQGYRSWPVTTPVVLSSMFFGNRCRSPRQTSILVSHPLTCIRVHQPKSYSPVRVHLHARAPVHVQ